MLTLLVIASLALVVSILKDSLPKLAETLTPLPRVDNGQRDQHTD